MLVTPLYAAAAAAAAAKLLQSYPTLCDPINGSPPGSPAPEILQARTLEWVAISFPMHESENEVVQSFPTLCDPMDCGLPGSSIHGIFQARLLEWGAIAFSNSLVWQWEIGHPLSLISLRCIVSTCIYLINLTVCNQSPNTATPWIWCCALRLWYLLLGHSFFHIWTAALVCYIFDTTCWTTVFTGRRAERFSSCLYL